METYTPTDVLITVMTYPHPSNSYQELVCTAGITRSGEWVRLYPIDYRYRPKFQQFHKYQWINIGLQPRGAGNDRRKESRKPDLDSINIIGESLSSSDGWRERRTIIDPLPHLTVNTLQSMYDKDKTSLGIVKPSRILDLRIEKDHRPWKPEWESLFLQKRLFGPEQKPLRKTPFRFKYVFECDDNPKPHTAMIEDWELGVLFLKESKRLGGDAEAAESVRNMYLNKLCHTNRDTRFFMGTVFPYNTWIVLGVFWPPYSGPEVEQLSLLP